MTVAQIAAEKSTTTGAVLEIIRGCWPNRQGVNEHSLISQDDQIIIEYIISLSA